MDGFGRKDGGMGSGSVHDVERILPQILYKYTVLFVGVFGKANLYRASHAVPCGSGNSTRTSFANHPTGRRHPVRTGAAAHLRSQILRGAIAPPPAPCGPVPSAGRSGSGVRSEEH